MPNRADLFADIDSMQPDRFAQHLSPDATMRFGNAPPVRGRTAIRDAWASFCETLDGVRHDVVEQRDAGDATIVEASVTYTRNDQSVVTVPVVTNLQSGGRTHRRLPDLHRPGAPVRDGELTRAGWPGDGH